MNEVKGKVSVSGSKQTKKQKRATLNPHPKHQQIRGEEIILRLGKWDPLPPSVSQEKKKRETRTKKKPKKKGK